MIFSAEKWNDSQELSQYVRVSVATSFEKMETPLRNAFETYIEPLLGEDMTAKLIEKYKATLLETDEDKAWSKLISIAQKANGNLAYYHDFEEINVRSSDSGFQRQETEGVKSLYQYQENNLRDSFRNKGFNGLDRMLEFLEKKIEFFPKFKESGAYTFRKKSIVPDASYANQFYFINSSRIVFLRLLPQMDLAEDKHVRITLGDVLYKHFKEDMFKDDYEGDDKKYFDTLRRAAARVIVIAAVRRLIIDGGSLTDRGLYFSGAAATSKSSTKSEKATGPELEMQLAQLEGDVKDAVAALAATAKAIYPESKARNPRDAFSRNNDRKRIFFT